MSPSQSVEEDVVEAGSAAPSNHDSDTAPLSAGPPSPPPPPAGLLAGRRSEDHTPPPPPPTAPRSSPSPPPPPPPPPVDRPLPPAPPRAQLRRAEDHEDDIDDDTLAGPDVDSGPGSTSYELDLLERKADHTAARLGALRSQLDNIRTGSKDRFKVEFERFAASADELPVRFPTPNKIAPEHTDLLRAAALLVRSGWVSPKLLDELDQLQSELHHGVCDLRQERSYARRRNWDGSPEIEHQAERLSERVHSPRLERVERRSRRVVARAALPGDFETLAKEYRRDFTDYSATLADVVAEVAAGWSSDAVS